MTNETAIDLAAARRHIEALTGSADTRVTFQTFDDTEMERGDLAKKLHGTLTENAAILTERNRRKAGVFVTVNCTDLKGRKTKNVTALRALFIDVDDGRPRDLALPASFIVHSARGPHYYWLLAPDQPLDRFTAAQERLAEYYDSDPTVKDLPRVMRLAGFLNMKAEPFRVTFEQGNGKEHTIEEVLEGHKIARDKIGRPPTIAETILSRGIAEAQKPDNRNNAAFQTGCQLRDNGMPLTDALALCPQFVDAVPQSDAKPFTLAECESAFRSAYSREPRKSWEKTATESPEEAATIPADWLDPCAVLLARPDPGEMIRTGFRGLDVIGGLPRDYVVTIQGRPGVGKTALAIQWGMHAVTEGSASLIGLFTDEGREAAAVRIGQSLGLSREVLRENDPFEIEKFRLAIKDLPIWLPDPHAAGNSIDEIVERAARSLPRTLPFIVITDSTQKSRCRNGASEESVRLRVTAFMETIQRLSKSLPALFLNVSQVNRASYRNKDDSENIDTLAAGAETRSLEFDSDVLFHLDGDTEHSVKLSTPKSRLALRPTLHLEFDFARASFKEVNSDELKNRSELRESTKKAEVLERDADKAYQIVRDQPGRNTTEIRAVMGVQKDRATCALLHLETGRWIKRETGTRNANVWRIVEGRSRLRVVA